MLCILCHEWKYIYNLCSWSVWRILNRNGTKMAVKDKQWSRMYFQSIKNGEKSKIFSSGEYNGNECRMILSAHTSINMNIQCCSCLLSAALIKLKLVYTMIVYTTDVCTRIFPRPIQIKYLELEQMWTFAPLFGEIDAGTEYIIPRAPTQSSFHSQ